jgi:hypothetical protein
MPIPPVLIIPQRVACRQIVLHTRPTPAVHRSVIHPHRHTATTNTTHIPILLLVLHISPVPLPHTRTVAIVPVLIRCLHTTSPVVPLYPHQPTLLVVPEHTRVAVRLFPTRQSALWVPRKTVRLTRPHILHRCQTTRHRVICIPLHMRTVQPIAALHHTPTTVWMILVIPTYTAPEPRALHLQAATD